MLFRLRRCAGWSVPLLFAYGIRHVFVWPGPFVTFCSVHLKFCCVSVVEFLKTTEKTWKVMIIFSQDALLYPFWWHFIYPQWFEHNVEELLSNGIQTIKWASSRDYGIYYIGDQGRLRWTCPVSPESSLFAHKKYGSRRKVRPKNQTSTPTGWCAWTFEEWVYGGRKVP